MSAELFQGNLTVAGVAIYPSKEERDHAYEDRPALQATFRADIWIEEH